MVTVYPTVRLDEQGILQVDFGPRGRLTRKAQQIVYEQHIKLAPNIKSPILVRCDYMLSTDREAERYASSEEIIAVIKAMAFVTKTPLANHLGEMFMWFSRPPYPVKLFTAEEKALEWLQQFVAE